MTGTLQAVPVAEGTPLLRRRGLLRMSPGRRNVVHADGTPLFLVVDTAWALPFRATLEEVRDYARDRAGEGFNAVLLMVVQPDRDARGPRERGAHGGFVVAFEDLPDATLRRIRPEYFRVYDGFVDALLDRGIVPIHQPVFHGFGWKGLRVAGPAVSPADYARFCRYLVARYGARPALWLVGADGTGRERPVAAGGREFGRDPQPCGIPCNPWQDNHAHAHASWMDFHLCQSGHNNEHRPEKVAEMHARLPVRAVDNGEPTYEGMGGGNLGLDWWQGEEAWRVEHLACSVARPAFGSGRWMTTSLDGRNGAWCLGDGGPRWRSRGVSTPESWVRFSTDFRSST